ncbi:MAG TPA: terminase family protein, partial [Stellaceae bacterium]|nr:terminase family protein [Stellaceae bacterium]
MLTTRDPTKTSELLASLGDDELAALYYDWRVWARPSQLPPPGDWRVWLLMAGRGFGKTRSGAEWVRLNIEEGRYRQVALVGPTASAVRDVMIEGESGLLGVAHPSYRPRYEIARQRLTWPNGAIAVGFSADEPDRLRGPQHDAAWCDELASWRYPEAWDMLQFGLRLGADPRIVVTTTPKPVRLIRMLVEDPNVIVSRGSTRENRRHLAKIFLEAIVKRYEGTRLGRQELEAELLDDVQGALWSRERIESARCDWAPELARVVVAIDPAVSTGANADETGIIAAGRGRDGIAYVLQDGSERLRAEEWARRAVEFYRRFQADRVVGEVNNGGDLVEATLRAVDPNVSYKAVRASRGKVSRAEPVAALYEQGRVKHRGTFAALEDQMCAFTADFDARAAGYTLKRRLGSIRTNSSSQIIAFSQNGDELLWDAIPFDVNVSNLGTTAT